MKHEIALLWFFLLPYETLSFSFILGVGMVNAIQIVLLSLCNKSLFSSSARSAC